MDQVFISYSREDMEFVHRLHEELSNYKKKTWVDWKDIPPSVEWMKTILSAIEGAQAFVFVISPHSLTSEVCSKEVNHAFKLNKRVMPILRHDVDVNRVPNSLAGLNWIFFRDGDDFDTALNKLKYAIDTDIDWVQMHTRLIVRATEWEKGSKDESFLLRGNDLEAAELWLMKESLEPKPTSLHREYILRSRERAIEEETRWQSLYEEAEQQHQIALSRQLAAQSELIRTGTGESLILSTLLAIESLRHYNTREGDAALRSALDIVRSPSIRLIHDGAVDSVAYSPDGKYLATGSWDNTARLWDVMTGEEVARMDTEDRVNDIVFSPDGQFLATASGCFESSQVYTARVWKVPTGEEVAKMEHDEQVESIDFSPDGRSVVTGSWDDTSRIWDAVTGREIICKKHDGHVNTVKFSPDGTLISSGGDQYCTVRLWRPDTGTEIRRIGKGGYNAKIAVFSPNGKFLAITDGSGVLISNIDTGEEALRINHERINVLEFSNNGEYLTTGGMDSTAKIWHVASGIEMTSVKHGDDIVSAAAFSPDNQHFSTGTVHGSVSVWNIHSGQEIARVLHKGNVHGLAFSPDGKQLATAAWSDNSAFVIDIKTNLYATCFKMYAPPTGVIYSPNGSYLAVMVKTDPMVSQNQIFGMAYGGYDPELGKEFDASKNAYIYDAASGKEEFFITHRDSINEISFSSDSRHVASASTDGTTRVWELSSGQEVLNVKHHDSIEHVKFRPNASQIVTTSRDKTVRVWDLETGEETFRLQHNDTLRDVVYSPNNQFLVVFSWFKYAQIWDADKWTELGRLEHDDIAVINDIDFLNANNLLATCASDKTARIWQLPDAKCLLCLEHADEVKFITFCKDGELVATVTGELVHIWEVTSGAKLRQLVHEKAITGITFHPESHYIASSSIDKTARIWDTLSGIEAVRIYSDDNVVAVAFSPDGKYLAVAADDGTVKIVLWRSEDLIEEACNRLTRNMSYQEWRYYFGSESYMPTCSNLPVPELQKE